MQLLLALLVAVSYAAHCAADSKRHSALLVSRRMR